MGEGRGFFFGGGGGVKVEFFGGGRKWGGTNCPVDHLAWRRVGFGC